MHRRSLVFINVMESVALFTFLTFVASHALAIIRITPDQSAYGMHRQNEAYAIRSAVNAQDSLKRRLALYKQLNPNLTLRTVNQTLRALSGDPLGSDANDLLSDVGLKSFVELDDNIRFPSVLVPIYGLTARERLLRRDLGMMRLGPAQAANQTAMDALLLGITHSIEGYAPGAESQKRFGPLTQIGEVWFLNAIDSAGPDLTKAELWVAYANVSRELRRQSQLKPNESKALRVLASRLSQISDTAVQQVFALENEAAVKEWLAHGPRHAHFYLDERSFQKLLKKDQIELIRSLYVELRKSNDLANGTVKFDPHLSAASLEYHRVSGRLDVYLSNLVLWATGYYVQSDDPAPEKYRASLWEKINGFFPGRDLSKEDSSSIRATIAARLVDPAPIGQPPRMTCGDLFGSI